MTNTRDEQRAEMERRREQAFRSMPSWRTRLRRRLLVGAVGVVVAAAVSGIHVVPANTLVPLAGMFVGSLVLIALRILTRGVAESVDSQLDERDRRLRDTAVRRAFLLVIGVVAVLACYVAATQGLPGLADRMLGLLITLLWVGGLAPTMVLAWILPDDDPEDLA